MKIAIYSQYYKSNEACLGILLNYLSKKEAQVFIEDSFYQLITDKSENQQLETFQSLDNSFDLLISIGGDGTILRAITYVSNLSIPIIGINTGRLGFLATIQNNQIESALDSIFEGNYKISERSLLCVETYPENKDLMQLNFALNEIAISRKNTTSMITVKTHLDGEYLTSYWADGLYRILLKLWRPRDFSRSEELCHNSYRTAQLERKTLSHPRSYRNSIKSRWS